MSDFTAVSSLFDTVYWTQSVGHSLLDTVYWTQSIGHSLLDTVINTKMVSKLENAKVGE